MKTVYVVCSDGEPMFFLKRGFIENTSLSEATHFDKREQAWEAAEKACLPLCEVKELISFD